MTIAIRSSTFGTLLLIFAASASAQDPPAPTPRQVTCADWGSYRFFELAVPDTVAACLAAGADPAAPVDSYFGTPLHHAARAVANTILIDHLLAGGGDANARDRRGRTPLHEAARANPNPGVIAALLADGADVNARDLRGTTPLHDAARLNRNPRMNSNPEVIRALLDAGADVNARDDRDNTPLRAAWQNPSPEYAWAEPRINSEAVTLLLGAGADPLALNQRGEAAGPGACQNWQLAVFARTASPADYAACVEAGTDLNARDESGYSVLHHATVITDTAVTTLLLEAGADPSARSHDDHTPLHFALRHRNNAVAAVLVRAGANVNVSESDEITPLHLAVYDEAVTTLLLEAGADVHARANGRTALHRAETAGVVDVLLAAGADINATGRFGTPLMTSFRSFGRNSGDSRSEVTRRLLARGADPNERSRFGQTALDAAAFAGPAVITALLDAGADPLLENINGETLLHTLAKYTSVGLTGIPLLLDAGVDVDLPNNNGETPLHLAAGEGRAGAYVALLLEAGADPGLRTAEGDTPLHSAVAALRPDSSTIAALVAAGADINARNELGRTPVQLAWIGGHSQVVDQLLALGAEPVAGDETGGAAELGCDWGDRNYIAVFPVASVRGCVETGTPLDAQGNSGDPPLHELAGSHSHGPRTLEILAVLVEAGVDVNARDDFGRTPLHTIASAFPAGTGAGAVAFARALLDAGAEVNARDRSGRTPLHAATSSRREGLGDSLVVLLVKAGAEVNGRTETGITPLHQALNHTAIATTLLELGADPAAVDDSGRVADPVSCENFVTPAFFALATPDIVAGCIEKRVSVNVMVSAARSNAAIGLYGTRQPSRPSLTRARRCKGVDRDDRTPLHQAAESGAPAIVRTLLEGRGPGGHARQRFPCRLGMGLDPATPSGRVQPGPGGRPGAARGRRGRKRACLLRPDSPAPGRRQRESRSHRPPAGSRGGCARARVDGTDTPSRGGRGEQQPCRDRHPARGWSGLAGGGKPRRGVRAHLLPAGRRHATPRSGGVQQQPGGGDSARTGGRGGGHGTATRRGAGAHRTRRHVSHGKRDSKHQGPGADVAPASGRSAQPESRHGRSPGRPGRGHGAARQGWQDRPAHGRAQQPVRLHGPAGTRCRRHGR